MGLAVSVALFALNSKQSLLGQMFNLNSIMALAPISMSCLFFWGVMLCILRWLRLRQAEQVSSKIILSKVTSSLGTTTLSGIMASLSSPGTTISPLLRRVQAIIRQWTIKPSLQDAALLLEHQELSDEDTIRNSYGVVRVFVWALPVLGLIGTVVGIALAVGNFAQFLGTNIDDVSLIKKSLVSVTGGLSYAFMNTLQGLLSSLLLMLPASALQSREERLISTIRRDISDVFLPALQRAFPESTTGDDIRGEKSFRETLVGVSESVLTKVGETTSHIVRQTEEQIKNWSGNLRTETEEGARRLGEVIGKLGKDLETSSNDFLTRLSMIQDSWDRHTSALGQLVEQQVQTNSQIRTDLMKAAEIHFASAENISRSIQGLAETTNTALQAQAVLQASIDKLSQANFNQSLDAVTSALKEVSGQTIIVSQAMNSLVGASQRILDSQQVLQGAVSQLQQMGLTETLVGFTSSLKQVSEVLAKFQEPIVFQAVRVSNILERKA
jgi:biopolymer transport protein ExbB/TolQ